MLLSCSATWNQHKAKHTELFIWYVLGGFGINHLWQGQKSSFVHFNGSLSAFYNNKKAGCGCNWTWIREVDTWNWKKKSLQCNLLLLSKIMCISSTTVARRNQNLIMFATNHHLNVVDSVFSGNCHWEQNNRSHLLAKIIHLIKC